MSDSLGLRGELGNRPTRNGIPRDQYHGCIGCAKQVAAIYPLSLAHSQGAIAERIMDNTLSKEYENKYSYARPRRCQEQQKGGQRSPNDVSSAAWYKQTFQIYVKGNLVKAIESRMQSLDNLSDI